MSTNTPTLFALAELADSMTVSGYHATSFGIDHYFGEDKPRVLRLTCTDGEEYNFADQPVTLGARIQGEAPAFDCGEDCVTTDACYSVGFFIHQPMTAADLLPAGQ